MFILARVLVVFGMDALDHVVFGGCSAVPQPRFREFTNNKTGPQAVTH